MVGDHGTGVAAFVQRSHHPRHVHITVVRKRLHESLGKGRADIAKMDLEQLLLGREVAYGVQYVLSRTVTALDPGSNTQAHADVWAVRDVECPCISGKIAKDTAGDTAKIINR